MSARNSNKITNMMRIDENQRGRSLQVVSTLNQAENVEGSEQTSYLRNVFLQHLSSFLKAAHLQVLVD